MAARKTTTKTTAIPSNVIVLDSDEVKKELAEREDLFAIDGRVYSMLKNPSATLMLQVLNELGENGQASASELAMREMLGQEGYDALFECKTLSREHFRKVTNIILEKVLGSQAADPKDNAENSNPEIS